MKLSILKIGLLLAVVLVLVSVSGGMMARAQTEVDKGPAGSSSGAASDQSSELTVAAVDTSVDMGGSVNGTIMQFKRFAGTGFYPRNSTYSYAESGSGGCIYNTANPFGIYTAPVHVPEGSLIDIVRFFWYDTVASNSTVWLSQYDDHGALVDIGSVSSNGAAGFGDDAFYPDYPPGDPTGYVVDNYTYTLLLNWRPVVSGSTMQLCGVRIRYESPYPFWVPGLNREP
jgi:hypothetical protein